MSKDSRSRRLFTVVSVTAGVVLVALVVASSLARDAELGHSIGKLEGIRDVTGNAIAAGNDWPPAARLRAAAAVLGGAWALFAVIYVLAIRRARWPLYALAILAWWILVEFTVAPFLVVPLNLWTYGIGTKVDHRPTNTDGEFNSDSLRGTPDPAAFEAGGNNVVFLGDSFTFGSGVSVDESFVHRFEALWNEAHPDRALRVANFGWVSSSPILSLRRIRDVGEHYHPKLVVMCLDMTDFSDDLRYGNILEKRGLYALYDKLPLSLRLLQTMSATGFESLRAWSVGETPKERFFASEHPLDETRRWLDVSAGYLREIHDWCAAHGSAFVLVVLPRCYQYDAREAPRSFERGEYTILGPYSLEPFRYFEEARARLPFPIVSLLPDFQTKSAYPTCFETDPHWNSAGHEVAARALLRELAPFVPR
jgi:hypothetical protein